MARRRSVGVRHDDPPGEPGVEGNCGGEGTTDAVDEDGNGDDGPDDDATDGSDDDMSDGPDDTPGDGKKGNPGSGPDPEPFASQIA